MSNLRKSEAAWARLRVKAAKREHPNRTTAAKRESVDYGRMMRENRAAGI